jgi:hypothetical protein
VMRDDIGAHRRSKTSEAAKKPISKSFPSHPGKSLPLPPSLHKRSRRLSDGEVLKLEDRNVARGVQLKPLTRHGPTQVDREQRAPAATSA